MNSFGFGGSNAHIILDDAFHYLQDRGLAGNHCSASVVGAVKGDDFLVAANAINRSVEFKGINHPVNGNRVALKATTNLLDLPKLLVWTAASEKAAKRMVQDYKDFYKNQVSSNPDKLNKLGFALTSRRSQMLWRSFAVVKGQEMVPLGEELSPTKPIRSSADVELAFVFTGQGAQYAGMGLDLIRYPVFATALQHIDDVYRSLGCEWKLLGKVKDMEVQAC